MMIVAKIQHNLVGKIHVISMSMFKNIDRNAFDLKSEWFAAKTKQ